jgi:hypothetical protein
MIINIDSPPVARGLRYLRILATVHVTELPFPRQIIIVSSILSRRNGKIVITWHFHFGPDIITRLPYRTEGFSREQVLFLPFKIKNM